MTFQTISYREALRYPVLPYPKGDGSPDYAPGFVLETETVKDRSLSADSGKESAEQGKSLKP